MLPPELEDAAAACVALLDQMEDAIHAAQLVYLSQVGQFCQLLAPHPTPPIGGVPELCDWSVAATDVGLSWSGSAVGQLLPAELPCSPRCDVWSDGSAVGYTITLTMATSAAVWEYRRAYGVSGLVTTVDWEEIESGV